jgi:hypothetical protein
MVIPSRGTRPQGPESSLPGFHLAIWGGCWTVSVRTGKGGLRISNETPGHNWHLASTPTLAMGSQGAIEVSARCFGIGSRARALDFRLRARNS